MCCHVVLFSKTSLRRDCSYFSDVSGIGGSNTPLNWTYRWIPDIPFATLNFYIDGAKQLKCLQHEILRRVSWVGFIKRGGKGGDVWISALGRF
ncbi:hypothetical protein QQF64_026624 [Cirrhinus molitorella]|uniref:Uncharacterized protein n=1 Tax=Cirrhinus molitorella TaxID=172907 RepID=A0ABR3NA37_9TELE